MRTIYANVLLSNGEILFWYIGNKCKKPEDFYRDFFYSHINMIEYEETHRLEVKKMAFIVYDESDSNFVFDVLAKQYFKRFAISADSKGEKPY